MKEINFPLSELNQEIKTVEDIITIKEKRNKLINKYDKTLLNETDKKIHFEDLCEIPTGRFELTHGGVAFDCLFHPSKYKKLYIFLSGAKTQSCVEFKRWSYYNMLDGAMLNIADPMYKYNNDLMLGWYYGTNDIDYRRLIVDIVLKIANLLNIAAENIVFISSSGGGAASIQCAGMIPNSIAAVINPQILLDLYFYSKTFQAKNKTNFNDDKFNRRDSSYWVNKSPSSSFLFIINANSKEDIEQINHLMAYLDIKKPLYYGLNKFNNVYVWYYMAENDIAHNAQEDKVLFLSIKNLIDNIRDLSIDKNTSNYLCLSELWNHIWNSKNNIKLENRKAFFAELITDSKPVVCLKNLMIEKATNNYSAIPLLSKLTKNTIYQIELVGAVLKSDKSNEFSVGLKDNVKQRLLCEKRINSKNSNFIMVTGEEVSNMEIKIYAGKPGETLDNELSIEKLEIKVLNK